MNSVLNPEAPEFYPHLTTFTQGGYVKVHKSIKSSNTLPGALSYGLFKTFTDFNILTCKLSENVVVQSNQIIATELPAVKLKQININIDTASGVNKTSDLFVRGVQARGNHWNQNSPVVAKIQVGSATFIGAKNITRPQINFKDTIDNSESLWVPKISDKPNNIKPLALNILYNEEGEAVGYEHPYKVELDLYHPPSQFIDPDVEPLAYPAPLEETMFTYVDTEAKLDALVEHLNTVNELAIDLEHHSYRTYQGITCLIQVTTTEGGDFIIDALAIREHIHKLNLAFTDPKKIKVFHGAEHDVIWLQRDFGVYLVGMFDTHQAATVLGLPGLSLKYLLMKYCQVDADKKYQLADWRMRPLPAELITYARMDTHYLLYIWRQMKAELLKNGQPNLLLSVFENSRQICGATYNKEVVTETSHIPLYVRSKKSFNSQQMAALKMLYKWRDAQARLLDESTTYLLPNHMLLALAETLPREMQGVNAVCHPMPPFVKQNLITIHRMLLSCRELPNEPQLYQMPTSIRSIMNTSLQPLSSYGVHDFAHYTDYSDEQPINLDSAAELLDTEYNNTAPEIEAFSPGNLISYGTIVSDLNADAQLFIPPYDRYRKYRSIAQLEEMKEYKEKEAKVAAISKGNELIKAEVLAKLQQAQTQIENEDKNNAKPIVKIEPELNDDTQKKTQQRKRKISAEKVEPKETVDLTTNANVKQELTSNNTKKVDNDVKPFAYKNVDYKKFYNHNVVNNKDHKQKQPKMKFKKYKN
ncbi:exosome component 10 isoform X2 [Spodoptera frugiperda]|uniref:Exosome complex component 10 homolog n=1 Tax=Spodoptera frugiperda TaxID=7108 RepID=A0A9R0CY91_SPOFR|nr:exosome component 10 isoform X2 [Spodoptera frugiperda]